MKNLTSITHENCEGFISLTLRTRNSRIPSRMLARIVGMVKNPIKVKSKLACTLEASQSTRLRMGEPLPTHHEDHIAGKGDNSLQHYKLVHKFIPMPQAMKIPAAKAAVDKDGENWRNFRRGT